NFLCTARRSAPAEAAPQILLVLDRSPASRRRPNEGALSSQAPYTTLFRAGDIRRARFPDDIWPTASPIRGQNQVQCNTGFPIFCAQRSARPPPRHVVTSYACLTSERRRGDGRRRVPCDA